MTCKSNKQAEKELHKSNKQAEKERHMQVTADLRAQREACKTEEPDEDGD